MLNRIKSGHIESHFSDFSETRKILLNHVRNTYKRNVVCDLRITSTLQVYSGSSVVLALCDTFQSVLFVCGSVTKLQMELRLLHEERDKLAKELKRTPELIEITLAQLREQCEYPKNSHSDGLKSMWSNVWGLTLSLNAVFRREQTQAPPAGAGAELGGGPEVRGRQRAGGAQPGPGPDPTWRVQSQPGGAVP